MSATLDEIFSQPATWRRAAALPTTGLPAVGEPAAVVGCGTSWFMAQSYAAARERAGLGATDAFTATEFPAGRRYERVVLLSRSGTTTEIVDLARALRSAGTPALLITAVGDGPATPFVDAEVVLDFADEASVVQTRFATTALAWMLSSLGHDVEAAAREAEAALTRAIPASWIEADQITFLGTGWTIGLANEAALKLREASQSWTEAYPAMEWRHGPMAIAQPGRLVWIFGEAPDGVAEKVAAFGAELVPTLGDPLAHLVLAQRMAVARAEARGLDPDAPRHLTRSVILG